MILQIVELKIGHKVRCKGRLDAYPDLDIGQQLYIKEVRYDEVHVYYLNGNKSPNGYIGYFMTKNNLNH